jgi:arsenate reductase (thioredoxin)
MNRKCKVLFLCRANAARSIMAEALLRQLAPEKFEAFSAGAEPSTDVHPMTLAQLRPTIPDLGKLRPKSWQSFTTPDAPQMDIVIAMCDEVDEQHAPEFAGKPIFCRWDFPDPLAPFESELEQKQAFERVFRQILRRVSVFVALPLESMRHDDQLAAVNAAGEPALQPVSTD